MKKTVILLLLLFCLGTAKAQTYVTIPDANFAAWLQTNIPSAMNGNQMDITSPAVTTRTLIDVENSGIHDLDGIQYFTSLKILDCGNGGQSSNLNSLASLPVLPVMLDSLICGRSVLTSLPVLPSTLKLLKCYDNRLSSLPALPNTLMYLDCSRNPLMTISTLPNSLLTLYCNGDQLTNLPLLPVSLITLSCRTNSLTTIAGLPNSIEFFDCSENQLTNVTSLPGNLKEFYCGYNQLTNLPLLPNNLEELYCAYNQLTSLPSLPVTLQVLDCWDNQLTSLPPVINCPLWILWCFNNQLTSLPPLPSTLYYLDCHNNLITCFDPFDDNFTTLDISNNPFTCLPNYIYVMDAMTLNYPLCIAGDAVNNPHNCPATKGIAGFTYKDNNANCSKDFGDIGLKNVSLQMYNNANNFLSQTYSGVNGVYQFFQTSGTYSVIIDITGMPFMPSCSNPGLDSTVTVVLLDTNVSFAFTCKPGFDIGIQSVFTHNIIFPGQPHTLNVIAGDMSHWYNLNCAAGVGGTVSFSVSGPVTYIGPASSALTPNVAGNVYTYAIADFGTVNNSSDFRLQFVTNPTAQTGDAICVNATVTPTNGDYNTGNNTYQYCYNVVNSHDPNIKEVYPVSVQPDYSDWLTYTIHFQNTGNANAINIRLQDVLDAKLNPETFEVLGYSHDNVIDLTGNNLTIRFPNIQLPDSASNPSGSIGFIQYRIKPKTNWVADTISNKAFIYFDYNAPIVTNTAKTYFMTTTGVKNSEQTTGDLVLFPNPAKGLLNISSQFAFDRVEVVNLTGQVLVSETVKDTTHQLQLQNLAEGIYFVKCIYANGMSITKKVVKQ